METDTKKRGRPRKYEAFEMALPDKEPRAAQNLYYAMSAITMFSGKDDPFFVSERGNIRRQGIAERIGRMYADGTITADQGRELIEQCKEDYSRGRSVKEITDALRKLHMTFKD